MTEFGDVMTKNLGFETLERMWKKVGRKVQLALPLQKTEWRLVRKLKTELPYDPAIPLLGIYPDETIIQKDTCTSMLLASLLTTAKPWKLPKCSLTNEWIWCVCVCTHAHACTHMHVEQNATQTLKRTRQRHLQQHGCNQKLSY